VSSAGLEHEAKLGLALAALAEEKAKRERLEKNAATKEDVEKMLADASKEQTAAIVVSVETLMKTPTAQKLKSALLPVLMVAIAIIGIKLTMILNNLQEAPPPLPTVVQLSPVTVYADAGKDQ
jgi:folylpolyglutamate synthase/dihydropteroate synthase